MMINLFVILICIGFFLAGVLLDQGFGLYLNLPAISIVLSGVIGAAFFSYPLSRILSAVSVAWNAYRGKHPKEKDLVMSLLDFSLKSRYEGMLALENAVEEVPLPTVREAMTMLVDGFTAEEIKDFLNIEMTFLRQRRELSERVFRTMAKTGPAFGLIGSVIGLMGMLAGIGDVGIIIKTIPIALTATLYGIVFNNAFFSPIAEKIHIYTQEELFALKLTLIGAVSISNAQNPYLLQKKLCSFMTPSDRMDIENDFRELRKRYIQTRPQPKVDEREKVTAIR